MVLQTWLDYKIIFIIILPGICALPIIPRLTLADGWSSYYERDNIDPDAYTFGYDLEDPNTGNVQYRQEERFPNGTVAGSYGFLEPDGNIKIVHYTADSYGYRVAIENSKGETKHYPPITMPLRENKENNKNNFYEPLPSDELLAAIESMVTMGQPVLEAHTPPKYDYRRWPNSLYTTEHGLWDGFFDDSQHYIHK